MSVLSLTPRQENFQLQSSELPSDGRNQKNWKFATLPLTHRERAKSLPTKGARLNLT
jgi:hypothetical protein